MALAKAKKKPVKKKKAFPLGGEKLFQDALKRWQDACEARGRLGQAAYDHQDKQTQAVIDRMRDRLRMGASGLIDIRVNGQTRSVQIEQKYLDFNILFIATEILKDMALMDIRVANYEFPPTMCAECGAEITKTKVPRRKGGRIK